MRSDGARERPRCLWGGVGVAEPGCVTLLEVWDLVLQRSISPWAGTPHPLPQQVQEGTLGKLGTVPALLFLRSGLMLG